MLPCLPVGLVERLVSARHQREPSSMYLQLPFSRGCILGHSSETTYYHHVVIRTKPCFGFCHLSTGTSWRPGHVRRGRKAVMLVRPCEKPDLTRSDLSLGLNNCEKVLEKSLTRLFPWTNSPCIFLIPFACFYVHSRILCVRGYIFLLLRASSHVLQVSVQFSRSFAVVLITRVIVTLLKQSSSGH